VLMRGRPRRSAIIKKPSRAVLSDLRQRFSFFDDPPMPLQKL